jgi:hypothetical protein
MELVMSEVYNKGDLLKAVKEERDFEKADRIIEWFTQKHVESNTPKELQLLLLEAEDRSRHDHAAWIYMGNKMTELFKVDVDFSQAVKDRFPKAVEPQSVSSKGIIPQP